MLFTVASEDPAQGARLSGTRLFQVVRGLLIRLLCLGLGVGVRRDPLDRLTETHGTAAGNFRLERVEAARNVQILGHMRRCDALADVLEAAARRLRVLARKRLDLPGNGGVVAQNRARRSV